MLVPCVMSGIVTETVATVVALAMPATNKTKPNPNINVPDDITFLLSDSSMNRTKTQSFPPEL
jgi:hypothetical protein